MRKGRATVVLKRAQHRIGIANVAGSIKKTARASSAVSSRCVAAQIVAERDDRAGQVLDVCARSAGLQDRVPDRNRRAAAGTDVVIVDATPAGLAGRVAGDRAVVDRKRRAALVAVVVDASPAAEVAGRVAANGAVVDSQHRAAGITVVEDAAAAGGAGRVAAKGAVVDRKRRGAKRAVVVNAAAGPG